MRIFSRTRGARNLWDAMPLSLRRLIEVKRAAGRPCDLEVVADLEAIAEEQGER